MPGMKRLEKAAATDAGPCETNQDRTFAGTYQNGDKVSGLFCMADGTGGLSEGEYAAATAVKAAEDLWNGELSRLTEGGPFIFESFFALFKGVNRTLKSHAESRKIQTATTCSILLILDGMYYIAHSGDSRIYKVDKKLFPKAETLTEDHISENGRLTSCLGAFQTPMIFTAGGEIKGSCAFLLCSDGLYRKISHKEMAFMAKRHKDCETLADRLVKSALDRKANDNVSAIAVKYTK